jgi:precorrin-8X/cobalt-precorrin-8 methylmutase
MTAPDRLFDRYVMVDWSANGKPKRGKDSVWIRSLGTGDDRRDAIANPATRLAASDQVRDMLVASVARRERVLVGFDFAYGYPRGFAAALGLEGDPWRAIWEYLSTEIVDGPRNANNRFAVASEVNRRLVDHSFWGCPHKQVFEHLSYRKDRVRYPSTQGDAGLPEWRATERAFFAPGIRPQPVWKLLGVGSVGSQALVGIPVVAALRDDPELQRFSKVWPFETTVPELEPNKPAIVHVEIWPSIVDVRASMLAAANVGKVKDQVQVEELALHFRALDDDGRMRDLFAAAPDGSDEEGWILGTHA